MQLQTQKILNEIETVKAKLISIEISLIKTEKPSKKDIKCIISALKEYKRKKTIPFGS